MIDKVYLVWYSYYKDGPETLWGIYSNPQTAEMAYLNLLSEQLVVRGEETELIHE